MKKKNVTVADLPKWFLSHPLCMEVLSFYHIVYKNSKDKPLVDDIYRILNTPETFVVWIRDAGLFSRSDQGEVDALLLEYKINSNSDVFIYYTPDGDFVRFERIFALSPGQ